MINVSKTYTDYENKIALSVPDHFIDVKTGNTHPVPAKVQEQIEFHAQNSTLNHLIFSALHDYFMVKGNTQPQNISTTVLQELADIKKLLQSGNFETVNRNASVPNRKRKRPASLSLEEVQDLLDSFGG